jgi:hypothetical protein
MFRQVNGVPRISFAAYRMMPRPERPVSFIVLNALLGYLR